MIFEFPFDLIVMTRVNPPISTYTVLYRQLLFLPFFLVPISTVSLLTSLPSMLALWWRCLWYSPSGLRLVSPFPWNPGCCSR
jgi:hypothetical protein